MEVKSLVNTDIEIIIECMTECFQNYFVKIPSDVDFWVKRYEAARVDYQLSFGAFDGDQLVAFIIQGIDDHNEEKTAFNTGTGVRKAYRGQKLVDQIYRDAIPILRENGIIKCMLEVIDQNHRAIRVYERIGFQKERFLRCFNGEIIDLENTTSVQEIDILKLEDAIRSYQSYYAWDSSLSTILKGGKMFKAYQIKDSAESDLGYFIVNNVNNTLIQIEAYHPQNWLQVLTATKKVIPSIRINNIDDRRRDCLKAFEKAGIQNHINQFEMIRYI